MERKEKVCLTILTIILLTVMYMTIMKLTSEDIEEPTFQPIEAPAVLRKPEPEQTVAETIKVPENRDMGQKRVWSGWDKQHSEFADLRGLRFGVAEKPGRFKVAEAVKPKVVIKRTDLEATVRETFRRMPHIKSSKALVDFIVETAIVESKSGYFLIGRLSSGRESGDYGVYQIRVHTAKDTMKWLKHNHADVHKSLMSLYTKGKPMRWNLIHNVPFSTAMAVTYYWRRDPHRLIHGIETIEQRADFWLDEYNTIYGKGTKAAYLSRVGDFDS